MLGYKNDFMMHEEHEEERLKQEAQASSHTVSSHTVSLTGRMWLREKRLHPHFCTILVQCQTGTAAQHAGCVRRADPKPDRTRSRISPRSNSAMLAKMPNV
jgi:hypothetical protein